MDLGVARAAGHPSRRPPASFAATWPVLAGSVGLDCDPGAHFLAQSGLDWLDLGAPGALAGSFWLLCALLGAPAGSIWLPTTALSTRLAKKIDLLIDDPASMLPASCALTRFFMPQT